MGESFDIEVVFVCVLGEMGDVRCMSVGFVMYGSRCMLVFCILYVPIRHVLGMSVYNLLLVFSSHSCVCSYIQV